MATKRILTVATSAAPDLNGAISGCWLSELTHFVQVVKKSGYTVDVASIKGGKIPLDHQSESPDQLKKPENVEFLADDRLKKFLEESIKIDGVDVSKYDALYLAGGHGTMWDFRESKELQKVITDMYSSGKIVSGVCHGVCGFIDSKDKNGTLIVKDKKVTGFSNFEDRLAGTIKLMPYLLEDDLKKNGAKYQKNSVPYTMRVEVDGLLITGQNPESAGKVGEEVVKALG